MATEIWRKKEEARNLEIILNKIDGFLREKCVHDWCYDDIDSISKSKNTAYCNKCNICLK
jgi:hypothetical protein